ncbi:hypothetical protein ACIQZO_35360 [Streptomyces sp. NPDC097617]|uniref:hypothetical protein n=1 Tax=Streptomyces sp. NPDC097617 TaxID=3366091 RepID=UPI00383038AF
MEGLVAGLRGSGVMYRLHGKVLLGIGPKAGRDQGEPASPDELFEAMATLSGASPTA